MCSSRNKDFKVDVHFHYFFLQKFFDVCKATISGNLNNILCKGENYALIKNELTVESSRSISPVWKMISRLSFISVASTVIKDASLLGMVKTKFSASFISSILRLSTWKENSKGLVCNVTTVFARKSAPALVSAFPRKSAHPLGHDINQAPLLLLPHFLYQQR